MNLNLQDLMVSHLLTAHTDQSLDAAYKIMNEKSIRHLPVIDKHGKLVGMLSERDLERSMISIVRHDQLGRKLEDCEFPSDKTVKDYMTVNLVTVPMTNHVLNVVEKMIAMKISSVLVVANNQVKGIVTTEDMLKLLARMIRNDEGKKYQTVQVDKFFDDSWVEMSG